MSLPGNLYCGPSGWSYAHWNNVVYPAHKSRGFHSLEFLSEYFDAIEINTTFYQSIRPEIARLWVQKVRANPKFLFTAKMNRRFTHDRILNAKEVAAFKEGLQPIKKAGKLGCLLMQFPWSFRFTEENRLFLTELRRAFHDYPLVGEMRHSSWMLEEALGTFIDYRIGFCNIDQASYTKAMPPTSYLTSAVGYVRLHGRNPRAWDQEFGRTENPAAQHDYLYSLAELTEWQSRIRRIGENAMVADTPVTDLSGIRRFYQSAYIVSYNNYLLGKRCSQIRKYMGFGRQRYLLSSEPTSHRNSIQGHRKLNQVSVASWKASAGHLTLCGAGQSNSRL